jgi:hypothetical protein
MHVERDDPSDVGRVGVSESETQQVAARLRENAPGPGEREESADLPAGVRDSGLEADSVELPEAREIFRTSLSQNRLDPGGDRVGVSHRDSDRSLVCAAMAAGRVVSLYVGPAASARMEAVESVRAVAGRGLEGDRYFLQAGTYSHKDGPDREITLIETEALEALARDYALTLDASESRRNVATRGVALNHLVGRTFRVGEATIRGLRLCEPCGHMERLCGKPVRPGLVHRGGLRAEILSDGVIRIGDPIEPI